MSAPKRRFLDELDPADREVLAEAISALPEVPPAATARERLLDAAARTHRFEELVEPFAEACDLDRGAAEDLLRAVDEPERWSTGPAPWIHLLHFEGGPKTARCITGIVKVEPGRSFPRHGHLGPETVLVLQGRARSGERTYERGDLLTAGPDDVHEVEVVSDIPLVYLAVVAEGIVLGGETITFDDPQG